MILVPLFACLALILVLGTHKPTWNWGQIVMRGGLLWGSYAVVATELLSLQSWVTREGVFLTWVFLLVVLIAWLIWRAIGGTRIRIPDLPSALHWYDVVLLVAILSVIVLTGVVAWFAPPQTWDSLNYHMPRVAHWAQQGSVRHFATGIEVQNSRTPGAEFLVLHAYILGSGDSFATFVQWLAMVLSLVGVATLAGQLGASRSGRLAGALFAATLPMGIVQASSTVTDYVVALWLVVGVSEVIRLRDGENPISTIAYLGMATGLALATKPTAVAYLAPFLAYAAYLTIATLDWSDVAKAAAVGLAVVLVLNAGHLARNARTYGSPLNPAQVEIHSNENRSPGGTLSNLIRHAGLQAGTPSPHLNKGIAVGIQWLHGALGLEVNDPRTTAHGVFRISQPTTNEDRAGNPLHAYLLVLLAASMLWRRKNVPRILWIYLFLLVIGMVVLSFLFKWQIFAARYHLPFFVLAAPAAGYLMVRMAPKGWILAFGSLMLVSALPWLFQIKSRPLIPELGDVYVGSIVSEPRDVLMMANGLNLLEPYQEMSRRVTESGCGRVGLSLSGNAGEYPLWDLLGAPSSELEIQWIVSGTPSVQHSTGNFEPCAIICESCPQEQDQRRGLSRVGQWAEYSLYLDELVE